MAKAIFVDGANLRGMGEPLGISRFDFAGLYTLLVSIGGDPELYSRPIFVIDLEGEERIGKVLRRIGFETIVADSAGSQDDAVIIQKISELPPDVAEIVIVSRDQDYMDVLCDKASRGTKIWVVGTRMTDRLGQSGISTAFDALFANGSFQFVELSAHKAQIMRRAWIDTKSRPMRQMPTSSGLSKRISIVLEVPTTEEPLALEALAEFLRSCPGAKWKVSGPKESKTKP